MREEALATEHQLVPLCRSRVVRSARVGHARHAQPQHQRPLAWMGTLIDGMRDNSGQMYMRNRYYDPASGRFTQEDPIGLAGGLNAYGYANGDPVSYDDAFGLAPRDVYVSCRYLQDTNKGAHCAVRIVSEKLGVDITYQLFTEGGNGGRKYISRTCGGEHNNGNCDDQGTDGPNEFGGRWVGVATPSGMTDDEFDMAVLQNAERIGRRETGRTYWMFGFSNSNHYVFDVIRASGALVPRSVMDLVPGALVPGICGGDLLGAGVACDPLQWRGRVTFYRY